MPSRPLTKEEIELFKQKLSQSGRYAKRNLLYFYMGIYTGFRINEILSMTISHVMKFPPNINKKIYLNPKNMKGKKEGRSVVINPILKQAIIDYLDEFDELYGIHDRIEVEIKKDNPDCPLFPSRKTTLDKKTGLRTPKRLMPRQMSLYISEIAKELKLEDISTHSLRKTYAKTLYDIFGKDIIKLQKGMGHKVVSSTQKYLSFADEEIEEGIMKLDFEKKN